MFASGKSLPAAVAKFDGRRPDVRISARMRPIAFLQSLRYEAAMNFAFKSERLLFRPLANCDLDLSMAILMDPEGYQPPAVHHRDVRAF